ncbi:hypothetical protein SH661x_000358 [Planctomicrobium sp. SH661]|uniref:hypothetical protein n=1 Tax=Planctomicrobium sp. SH661 TaxID=3448124 RepID=UPI003F5CA25B
MLQQTLNERFDNWNEDLSIDVENRLVLNVALAGQSSRNGYRYTDEALLAAAGLYEGKPVFLDHAPCRQRPQERSTRDLVGSITNPRFVAGRIRGDIRVLETESGQTFLKLVESKTPGVGMSHVVVAERTPDGKTVLRIAEVLSVDVVVNPATTSTFSESNSSSYALDAAEEHERLRLEYENLQAEVRQLRQRLADWADRDAVRQLIASSGLPQEAVSECFHRQLMNAGTPALRQQLLQDRATLLAAGRRDPLRVASQERAPVSSRNTREDEFVRVLKRR